MEAPPLGGHDPIPSTQPRAAPAEGEDGSSPTPLLSEDWSQRGGALWVAFPRPHSLSPVSAVPDQRQHMPAPAYTYRPDGCAHPDLLRARGKEAAACLAAWAGPRGWAGGV